MKTCARKLRSCNDRGWSTYASGWTGVSAIVAELCLFSGLKMVEWKFSGFCLQKTGFFGRISQQIVRLQKKQPTLTPWENFSEGIDYVISAIFWKYCAVASPRSLSVIKN